MARAALICPGQGAQKIGMGKDLCMNSKAAREIFDGASRALGFDITKICFEGPEEELNRTDVAQPAILTTTMASLTVMKEKGQLKDDRIAVCAGLSLGEYSALCYAGALEFEDAVKLVRNRGRYMQEACDARSGGMLSLLGTDVEKARKICEKAAEAGEISVANLNCPGQVVISGETAAIEEAEKIAGSFGVKRAVRLRVAGAFHSALMKPAGDRLARDLADVNFTAPRMPVAANATAEPHGDSPDETRKLLERQVSNPVYWEKCMRWVLEKGIDRFYEPAPGRVLAGLMKKIEPSAVVEAGPA